MTTTLTCPAEAIHLAPAQPDAETLDWLPYDGSRYRTHFASCLGCYPDVVYEWGTLGGTFRIRRTNLKTGQTHVTPWVAVKEAASWWLALQEGRAI